MTVILNEQSKIPVMGGVKELLSIAVPMIISTACDGIMVFTDRLMLSRLGPEHMNASMAGGVSIQVAMFFFIGLIGYSTALAAQYFGSGHKRNASATAFQAFLIALIAFPVVILWLKPALFVSSCLGISKTQYDLQYTFMKILAFGSVFGLIRHTLSCFFSGIGRTKVVMFATLSAMILNVILNYILIYGKFGLPQLGIAGAGIATISGHFLAAVILIYSYFRKENRTTFFTAHTLRFNGAIMKKLLRFGYPAGLEMFLNFFAFSAMTQIFQSLGAGVATATTIMFNWDLMAYIPLLGIEIAVTSLVGRYMGARKPDIAEKSAYSAVKVGMVYSTITMIVFIFIPGILVNVFRPDVPSQAFTDAVPLATSMIRLAALYVLAEAMMVAFVGALRGSGDTIFAMLWSVCSHYSFVAMLWIMFKVFHMPPITGWLVLVIMFLGACGFLFLRFKSGKWRGIILVEQRDAD
jgi:multidrug resistance protein, MATE family